MIRDQDVEPQPVQTPGTTSWMGVAGVLVVAILWSLSGALIKLINAQGSGVSGFAIAFYRSVIGGVVFLPWAYSRREALRRARARWLIGSVASFTVMSATFVIATTLTAASSAIILQYTAPIWVFLASPLLLNERAKPAEAVVLAISMVGVAIIWFGSGKGDSVGLATALVSGLGYGLLMVSLRGLRAVDPFVLVCMNCFGSAIILAPAVGVWGSFRLTPSQLGLLMVLGTFQFGAAYALFAWALRHIEAHRASLIALLETLLNPVLTYAVVGERVPLPTLIGGPFILAGVVGWLAVNWQRERALRRVSAATR